VLLIGSRAARIHFPDFRRADDWDVVVDDQEFEELSQRLGEPMFEPKQGTYLYRFQGEVYEVKRHRHRPLWSAVLDRAAEPSEGELMARFPVLGECRVASPPLLLILKQCFVAYPILHWRKSLLDYHFLKQRIERVPPSILEISRIAVEEASEMFGHLFEHAGDLTITCAHDTRHVRELARHQALHERFRRGKTPLAQEPDAWQGFTSHPIAERRELMVELLVEEAMVVGREHLEDLNEPIAASKLYNWTLRMLITQHLPLAWRYFAADHFPQIQQRILATE
jgi:hypothetical protein